jgi:transglutaminase-like putative cysteine protease
MSSVIRWIYTSFMRDWQQNIKAILITIILYQFVIWFENHWLDETRSIVVATLISLCILECFSRYAILLIRVLQFIAILVIHYRVLDIDLAGGPWKEALQLVRTNAEPLFPFIGFALTAWVAFITLKWFLTSKFRVLFILILCVMTFAIADSYSEFVFWDQVAWIIVSGLIYLMIQHFQNFKAKYPDTWGDIVQYPGVIISIVAVLFLTLATAALYAPHAKPLVIDPYTALKQWQGAEVAITANKGQGGFRITSSAANKASGYGRDDSEIGGGFTFNYEPVMEVTTTRGSYWRGETRALYTGKGWEKSELESNSDFVSVNLTEALAPNFEVAAETLEVKQTFKILEEGKSFPVLFGAYPLSQVTQINETSEQSFPLNWFPQLGELHWDEETPYPTTYSVVSSLPVIDFQKIREIPFGAYEDNAYFRDYLQVPDTLPDRVKQLAEDITAEAETPFDKVKAIENYLYSNYTYNNRPDLSEVESEDLVDQFLFEIKEGYCDYYSTAMVMLTRSLGMPARWVKGYTLGENQTFQYEQYIPGDLLDESDPTDAGTYVVRNADAHSWPEVYFEGYGWLPFEPTSGFTQPLEEAESDTIEPLLSESIDSSDRGAVEGSVFPNLKWWLVGSTACILIVLISLFLYRNKGLSSFNFKTKSVDLDQTNRRVVVEFNKMLKYFRRKGLTRTEYETLHESFDRWKLQYRWLSKDLDRVLHIFEQAKYGKQVIKDQDWQQFILTMKKCKEELK